MVEFDVDMGYLLSSDELDKVVLNDENGEHEPMEFVPKDAAMRETCHMEVRDNLAETEGMGDVWLECDKCHWQMPLEPSTPRFRYCPNCRAKVVSE